MLINYEKTRGDGAIVTDCLNLRPDRRGDTTVLVPAGASKLVAPAGYTPLIADGDYLLATRGSTIYAICVRGGAGEPREVCTLTHPALCAIACGDGITVMTGEGVVQLRGDEAGNYKVVRAPVEWPGVTLTGRFSHVVEAEVSAGPIDTVGDRLCEAYAELDRQALATGTLLQPVLARVRLFDAEGRLLHVGPPVVVSGPDGAQLCGSVCFDTTGTGAERTTKARMITARAWQLHVSTSEVLPAPWRDLGARLEVEVTPQFHPYDRAAQPIVTTLRGSAEGEVTVTMPGRLRGLSGTDTAGAVARLEAVAARFDSLKSTVAHIIRPFAEPVDMDVSVSRPGVETETIALEKNLSENVATQPFAMAALSVPHRFSATCVGANAATVLWGNARPVRFTGYDASWFASTYGAKSWLGSVTVEFADGARVVRTLAGRNNPVSLNPMLSYPLASAVRLTLSVHADGDACPSVVTVPLHPDATGTRAVWISDDLQPVALVPTADFEPGEAAEPTVPARWLVAAHAGSADTACAVAGGPGEVTAIEAMKCSSPTRDSQPAHFYVATRSHINVVTTTPSAGSVTSARLAASGVPSQSAVTSASEAVYALSDGNLLRLKGMDVATVATGLAGDGLCFDPAAAELMVVNSDDNECVHLLTRRDMLRYHTSLVASGAVVGNFVATPAGIVDLSQRTVADRTQVLWRARYVVGGDRAAKLSRVIWLAKGNDLNINLSIERAWLTDAGSASVATTRVSGRLLSPVCVPLDTHPMRDAALRLDGSVSADFAMTQPVIEKN